jgi:hypothetical protein
MCVRTKDGKGFYSVGTTHAQQQIQTYSVL